MENIEACNSDETVIWNDYATAKAAVYNTHKIVALSTVIYAVGGLLAISVGHQPLLGIAMVCHAMFVFVVYGIHASIFSSESLFGNKTFQVINSCSLIPITLTALFSLKWLAIFPIFEGMSLYSSYLQIKDLTDKRILELSIIKTKEDIASDKPAPNGRMTAYTFEQGNYFHLIFFGCRGISEVEVLDLLNYAYPYKKILSFAPITFSRHFFSSYDEMYRKKLEVSVDYLIHCKQKSNSLDEQFINTQLKYLGYSNANFYKSNGQHLYLSDDVPLIMKEKHELGDISGLKQKLIDCFGSVREINLE